MLFPCLVDEADDAGTEIAEENTSSEEEITFNDTQGKNAYFFV